MSYPMAEHACGILALGLPSTRSCVNGLIPVGSAGPRGAGAGLWKVVRTAAAGLDVSPQSQARRLLFLKQGAQRTRGGYITPLTSLDTEVV